MATGVAQLEVERNRSWLTGRARPQGLELRLQTFGSRFRSVKLGDRPRRPSLGCDRYRLGCALAGEGGLELGAASVRSPSLKPGEEPAEHPHCTRCQ